MQYAFFFPSGVGIWVQRLLTEYKHICIVAENESESYEILSSIKAFNPDIETIILPQWDTLAYASISPSLSVQMQRKRVFERMSGKDPTVVIAPIMAALQKQAWKPGSSVVLTLQQNTALDQDQILQTFVNCGFTRVETVYNPGEFCIRGGIIDVFLPSMQDPVRIDLFGDEVESIHVFDPQTQRRFGDPLESISISNPYEISKDNGVFRTKYVDTFGVEARGDFFHKIIQGLSCPGWEQLYPLFYEKLSTVFELFPHYQFFVPVRGVFEKSIHSLLEAHQQRAFIWEAASEKEALLPPVDPNSLYITSYDQEILAHTNVSRYSPLKPMDGEDIGVRPVLVNSTLSLIDFLQSVMQEAQLAQKRVVIATQNMNDIQHLQALYHGHFGSTLPECDSWEKVYTSNAAIVLWKTSIQHSFSTNALILLSGVDLFGHRIQSVATKKGKKRSTEDIISHATAMAVGDIVVHALHGISRYLGLETIQVFDVQHDCVALEYAHGDKLYLPVENIELLSRYGNEVGVVVLDKLGGVAWQARQLKIKKQLRTIAKYLMGIAAKRLTHTAPLMIPDPERYVEFCRGFPFMETEDQERSIVDVLGDLSSGKLMDRLVCGDVGFGKTEVAMRAVFAAVEAGYQVGIIAPTTLLVRQHYHTFKKRFESFGVRIEQLSRMVTGRKADEIVEATGLGNVHVLIGTHALLNKRIMFQNLGLLIVDEEQLFGVKQKEQIKEMCKDVHVLTLSATPIPRTLQLSLAGIKEMSIIATPPMDRRAIQTVVGEEDPIILHQAIRLEIDRGGQVFYVCPRISDLPIVQDYLKKHHPELVISIAHGQMKVSELEEKLWEFVEGKSHILLSTQIIESGIDIPNVNTMIIHNAHMFGLAQLYQLRGRIGRSDRQAYAYLMLPKGVPLPGMAAKRLHVMSTLDTLGAGFTLASHDMDIRGAGNLLGEEQSGHIKEIGVELYQSMLKQAVQAVQKQRHDSEDEDEVWSPTLSLGLSIGIPNDYVNDGDVRMDLYRRLGQVQTQPEMEELFEEMKDRFGPIPETVKNLKATLMIKLDCRVAHLQKVETGPKGVLLTFRNNKCPYVEKLLPKIQNHPRVKIRPDQKLFYSWEGAETQGRVLKTAELCKKLADLATI